MRRNLVALLAVLSITTAAGSVAVASPAQAGARDEPIYADLNGDGLTDKITLSAAARIQCATIVE